MRGTDQRQSHVFSYISPEQRVRSDHPLRPIRTMVDEILKQLSPQFNKMYAKVGRPSIPPEHLLRAQLLQMLYSVRSERLLVEEMDYNILFRWFVGLNLDDAVWDATVFTKNRDRLLEAEVAKEFLARVVGQAREKGWTSDKHFSVDGTLLEAWASGSHRHHAREATKRSMNGRGSSREQWNLTDLRKIRRSKLHYLPEQACADGWSAIHRGVSDHWGQPRRVSFVRLHA